MGFLNLNDLASWGKQDSNGKVRIRLSPARFGSLRSLSNNDSYGSMFTSEPSEYRTRAPSPCTQAHPPERDNSLSQGKPQQYVAGTSIKYSELSVEGQNEAKFLV